MKSQALPLVRKERTKILMELFEEKGNENYGEQVTQLQHAVQAATSARNKGFDPELIVAAFLHDVGHLLDEEEKMEELGNQYHENLGADYLSNLGFSKRIQSLVKNHVEAKRYLTAADKTYLRTLSAASLKTLSYQGGPMDDFDKENFEKDPFFKDHIRLRQLDDAAKVENYTIGNIEWIWEMIDTI
ncbi:MAG: HDIG domain-containing protein [Saprospiraceae bacterium]